MKRMHVHVGVENLEQAISFYSTLFSAQPSVVKSGEQMLYRSRQIR